MTNFQSNEKIDAPTAKRKTGMKVRYFLLFNSFFAFIMVYANKVVLSVAIVAMVGETLPIENQVEHIAESAISNGSLQSPPLNSANFAALHSGNPNAFNDKHNLTNSPLSNEPNGSLRAASTRAIDSNQPHPIMLQHRTNQVGYDHMTKSKVLGAFFYGYIVTQVPAGRLAERFGAKHLLGWSMFLCSIMSLVIPVATLAEKDFESSQSATVKSIHVFMSGILGAGWALQILRCCQGVCAGVAHPCMHALITRWTPKNERSMTTAFIYSGSQIGTVIIMPITGYLSSSTFLDGWPATFYLLGILGTVWFILWCIFVYDTPDKHPFISQEELQKLKIGIGDEISHDHRDVPWLKVFSSWSVYALIAAHFGQNFGFFMLLTELPSYLKEELGFNIKANGVISALPYLVQAVTSWVASYISDSIVKKEKYPLSWVRKGFNSVGFFGPAICFVGIAMAGKCTGVVILLLVLSLGFNGFAMSGFHVTHVDMAPDFAGTLMGITNGISNFNGIIAPFIVTAVTTNNVTEWWAVFLIACGVYTVTNIVYCWFGTSQIQSWARSPDKKLSTVFVCDNSHPNGSSKKEVYLLQDMRKDSHLNGNSKQAEANAELLPGKH